MQTGQTTYDFVTFIDCEGTTVITVKATPDLMAMVGLMEAHSMHEFRRDGDTLTIIEPKEPEEV